MNHAAAQLARIWSAIQGEAAALEASDQRIRGHRSLPAVAADLVTYLLAGQPIDPGPTLLPDELAAHLAGSAAFDDAAWEEQPSYLELLGAVHAASGTTTAQRVQQLLIELAVTVGRLGPGLTETEWFQIDRLRGWKPSRNRASILLVHGMAQQRTSAAQLSDTWLRHLRVSFAGAGLPLPEGDSFRLAYYADLVDGWSVTDRPSPAKLLEMLASNLIGRRSPLTDLLPTTGSTRSVLQRPDLVEPAVAVVKEIARGRSDFSLLRSMLRTHPLVTVASPPPNGAPMARRPSRARAARIVGHLSPSARDVIVKRLREVWLYLTDGSFRARVQDRLHAALDGSAPTVIVGHSLGSVVAMDHLLRQGRPLPALVTMGSPLWMPTVLQRLIDWHVGNRPVVVGRWTNLFDGRDVVGGGHPMARAWGPKGPEDVKVANDHRFLHHNISDYLSHERVAQTIGRAIGSHLLETT